MKAKRERVCVCVAGEGAASDMADDWAVPGTDKWDQLYASSDDEEPIPPSALAAPRSFGGPASWWNSLRTYALPALAVLALAILGLVRAGQQRRCLRRAQAARAALLPSGFYL